MVKTVRPVIACLFLVNLLYCGTGDGIQDTEAYGDAEFVEINDEFYSETGEYAEADAETMEFSEVSETGDVPQEYYVTFPLKLKTKCKSKSDCVNVCGTGDCIEETCQFMPKQNYCILKDSDESTYCFKPMMNNSEFDCLFCNPLFHQLEWTPLVFMSTFEGGDSKGMAVYDLTGGGIVWTISSLKSGSGNYSLYFGDLSTGTYSNGKHVAASVVAPGAKLPEDAATSLRFSLYLDTEQTKGYDIFKVNVLSGGEKEEVYNSDSINGTTGGVFIPVEIGLGKWAGNDVKIEFVFDSIDSGINSFEGAYIDDIVVKTLCCGTGGDCNDFNPCTSDECEEFGGGCKNLKKEKCCANLLDCDDGDVCTVDNCPSSGGECKHDKIEGCCNVTGDCNDNNSCTEDLCVISKNKCLYKPICCTTDGDCKADDKCLMGKCEDWTCVYADICCKSDSDCDDNEKCTTDFCQDGDCVHKPANLPGCCFPEIFTENFDSGDGNFTFSPPVNGIGWQIISGGTSTSSPMSLYYGNPATKKYAVGNANSGSAKTVQPIKIPEGLESSISFNLYMDTDSGDYYDILTLNVIAGDKTSNVWKKGYGVSMKKFQKITVDVSEFGGLEIFLEFFFDTGYTYWEKYGEGVYIDDLDVATTCEKKQCAGPQNCLSKYMCKYGSCNEGFCNYVESCCYSNEECDDADICTTDSCLNGKCSFVQIKGCCKSEFDCNDINPCTLDVCSGFGGQCSNPAITGCCLKNADCDDKDNCTKDICLENVCVNQYVCCQNDADCDDNDDLCTIDKCVGGFCKYTLTGAEGCCKQEIYYADFNGGDLNGIELSPPLGGVP
ncbi:MAG: hypothetical protein FJ088_04350, partial [Deltaproteobacteria bacterium]|nr:hypothetical protein [Deltaproteobacteria bacterium]